jgi:hypothetical protein
MPQKSSKTSYTKPNIQIVTKISYLVLLTCITHLFKKISTYFKIKIYYADRLRSSTAIFAL